MYKGIYMLYDVKEAILVGQCYIAASDGAAIREFHDVLANPQTTPGRHPEDFDLYKLGMVDITEPEISGPDDDNTDLTARAIARGKDWLDAQKPRDTPSTPRIA